MINLRLLFLLVSVFGATLFAQGLDKDAQLRLQYSFDKKLNSNYQLNFNLMGKFNQNFSQNDQNYLEVNFERRIFKNFQIGVSQRFILARQIGGVTTFQYKTGFYSKLKQTYRRWSFEERIFIQSANKAFNALNYENSNKPWRCRVKFTTTRKINKFWKVYAGLELYVNAKTNIYPFLARERITFGLNKKINKHTEIKPYFMFQNSVHLRHPISQDFIYGLTLHSNF